ncbi:MAG: Wzy polymerase domain-containing protein [Rhodoferax sp.]|nr:Wzy polymerase domain-containing protein [Rhodoferax sp.]
MYVQLCVFILIFTTWSTDGEDWSKQVAVVLILAAIVSVVLAMTQALGVFTESGWVMPLSGYRRPGANIGQPNHLGTLVVMGAASLVYLNQRRLFGSSITVLLGAVLTLGMAITESRTGLLSGLLFCAWLVASRRALSRPFPLVWVCGFSVALALAMFSWPALITYIQQADIALPGTSTLNTKAGIRLEVWLQLLSAICIKPWLGWGFRNVSVALNAVGDKYANSGPFSYAHNFILDAAIGFGLPLTILMILVIAYWTITRVRQVKTIESGYAVGLLIPFSVHSMLEYPFAYAYFLIPAALAVGLLERNYKPAYSWKVPRMIILVGLTIFSFVFVWIGYEYVALEEDFRVARFEAISVGNTPAAYQPPEALVLNQLGSLVKVVRSPPAPGMSKEEVELARMVALRFPWAVLQGNYALVLALNGFPGEARRQVQILHAMHGEASFTGFKSTLKELSDTKYPQLKAIQWL